MPEERFRLIVEQDTRGAVTANQRLEAQMGRTSRAAASLGKLFAFIGGTAVLGSLARSVFRTGKEFEQLRVGLVTVTGSAAMANKEFARIKQFAATTPFEVANITRAFTMMKAKGLEPTAETLRRVGDLAAAFGRDITEAERAITSAMFGETEAIKQFGIVIRQQMKTASVTFQGETRTIKRDAASIRDAILEIAETKFAGSMQRQAATLEGALSNLRDSWDNLADAIFQAGIVDAFNEIVRGVTAALDRLERKFGQSGFHLVRFWRDLQAGAAFWEAATIRSVGHAIAEIFSLFSRMSRDLAARASRMPRFLRMILLGDEHVEIFAAGALGFAQTALEIRTFVDEFASNLERGANELIDLNNASLAAEAAARNFGEAIKEAGQEAAKAAPNIAKALEIFEKRQETLEAWAKILADLPSFQPIPLGIPGEGPQLIPDVREEIGQFSQDLRDGVAEAMASAIKGGLLGGESAAAREAFARALSAAVSRAVAQAIGAALGAGGGGVGVIFGALAGTLLSAALSGGGPGHVPRFFFAIELFADASQRLSAAAETLIQAANNIRGSLNALRSSIGGGAFFTGLGVPPAVGGKPQDPEDILPGEGGLIPVDFRLVATEFAGRWNVAIEGIMHGVGDTLEDAVRNMFDRFARELPALIRVGVVSLEGVPRIFADVLQSGVAQSWEDLQEALETASRVFFGAVGRIRAEMFQHFSDLAVTLQEAARLGIRNVDIRRAARAGVEDFLNDLFGETIFQPFIRLRPFLREFAANLERIGIVGEEAARLLDLAAQGAELFNRQLVQNVLGSVAQILETTGVAKENERLIARIKQAQLFIEIEMARVRLAQLRAEDRINRDFFRELMHALNEASRFARRIRNFMGEAADSAADLSGGISDVGSTFSDVLSAAAAIPDLPDISEAERWLESNREILRQFAASMEQVARPSGPLAQLQQRWNEFATQMAGWATHPLFQQAQASFLAAWARTVDKMKEGLTDFVAGLRQQFGRGTPLALLGEQRMGFSQLLAAALGGDETAFAQLQQAAQSLLQAGTEVLGTSTAAFSELFGFVQSGLQQALGATFSPQLTQAQAQTAATQALLNPVQDTATNTRQIVERLDVLIARTGAMPAISGAQV